MVEPLTIDLPWPVKQLSPNARVHWATKSKAAKKARKDAGTWTYVERDCARVPQDQSGNVHMTITFHPPDKRRRDRDNMIASLKSAMDGVADGLGIDDRHFLPTYRVGEPIKHGRVVVSIASAERTYQLMQGR